MSLKEGGAQEETLLEGFNFILKAVRDFKGLKVGKNIGQCVGPVWRQILVRVSSLKAKGTSIEVE